MLGTKARQSIAAPAISLDESVPPDQFYRHLERHLMRLVADRLSIRWYLGYNSDEPLPDHSSLTRIRSRYGVDVFRRFLPGDCGAVSAGGLRKIQDRYC